MSFLSTNLASALFAEADDAALDALAERLRARLVLDSVSQGWLDVAGAAEYLSCPKSRIYSLVSAKRIPHERDGSRLLFDPASLDAYVRAGGARRP